MTGIKATTIGLGFITLLGILAEASNPALAQADAHGYGPFEPYAQLGALAAVVGLLVWIITVHLPRQAKAHDTSITAITDRYSEREQRRDEVLSKMADSVSALSTNCERRATELRLRQSQQTPN